MTIQEIGSDVVENGNGTINLSALAAEGSAGAGGSVYPSFFFGSAAIGGPTGNNSVELYGGISGPSSFGSNGYTVAGSGGGDVVGVISNFGLYLPSGYVSGAALSDESTFLSTTLSGLGLTSGDYTWTWGTSASADYFELEISQTVPEPSTFGLLAIAAVGFMLGCYFRRTRVVEGSPREL
jgi:hypothetical protein